jgi:hypothetical protein
LGQKVPEAYREAYRVDDKAYRAYTLPHTPEECPCCRIRSEAWEKLRAEFEMIETESDRVGSENKSIVDHLADTLKSSELTREEAKRLVHLVESRVRGEDNPARKEEHDPDECPGCRARWAVYRKMEEEEREAARSAEGPTSIGRPGYGELTAGEQGLPFMPYPTEEPNGKESADPEDAGQTYFDLGALQERGEVASFSEGDGSGVVILTMERGQAATEGEDGKRYPWKEWVASGCSVSRHVSKDDPDPSEMVPGCSCREWVEAGGPSSWLPVCPDAEEHIASFGFMSGTDPDPEARHCSSCECDACHLEPVDPLLGGESNECLLTPVPAEPVVHTPLACPCGSDHSRVGDREFFDGVGPGGHDDTFHPVSDEARERELVRRTIADGRYDFPDVRDEFPE